MKKLFQLTIKESLELLKSRQCSSRNLTEACLEQVSKYDPEYKAFVTVLHEQALHQAELADKDIADLGE